MRKLVITAVVLAIAAFTYFQRTSAPSARATRPRAEHPASSIARSDASTVATAFADRANGIEVQDEGTVASLLRDDRQGSPHQRILVRVDSGVTVLIAHNIDLAPRVEPLQRGDRLSFRGEYVWNEKGGVVHWTHRDPSGRHSPGWIRHDGRTFE